jgi:hypothetical protein
VESGKWKVKKWKVESGNRERGKQGKRERGKEGKRERGKQGNRETGKQGNRECNREWNREQEDIGIDQWCPRRTAYRRTNRRKQA